METTKLKTFLAIATYGSFKAAADKLFLSPRAVSKQMNQIEAELGTTLFTREKNNTELTPMGKQFLVSAQDIVNSYNTAVNRIALEKHQKNSNLQVGFSSANQALLLQELLRDFVNDHPKIKLTFKEENGQRLADHVSDGSLDFALTPTYDKTLSLEDANLYSQSIVKGNLVVGVSQLNPLSQQDTFDLHQLGSLKILYYSPTDSNFLQNIFMEKFADQIDRDQIRRVATLEQRDVLVAFNYGVGFYPSVFLKRERTNNPLITYLPVAGVSNAAYSADVIYNQYNDKAALKTFLNFLADWLKQHPASSN
ncbi:LysR family transcriptional regulator [Lactiplantibacillus modestisalitolerans]|uniref:LysR family transcriptional regulator n=1 Tax=Lactiplantibacillus modestisalitolerans TaxID=1457219 RepID=A0ABV5WU54_9LACO|nr:LysR family transcriptional regulator [Lactiplantibacillus modestisalitolerans]